MDTLTLKPCPFCGEPVRLGKVYGHTNQHQGYTIYHPDTSCFLQYMNGSDGYYEHEENAVEAWNKRT